MKSVYHFQKINVGFLILYIFFIWYVLFPGLSIVLAGFDKIDDMLYGSMLILGTWKLFSNQFFRINRMVFIWFSAIAIPVVISTIWNFSSITCTLKYAYSIGRPLIIYYFIVTYKIHVFEFYNRIVQTAKIVTIINLPIIIYNLAIVNTRLFQSTYHDSIVGFFPFQNNDGLCILYLIILYHSLHKLIVVKDQGRKDMLWTAISLYLLLSTVNLKYIALTVVVLGFILLTVSLRAKIILISASVISFILLHEVVDVFTVYYNHMYTVPIIKINTGLFSGSIEGYNLAIGAGGGMFTSPVALKSHTELSEKYIWPLKIYYDQVFGKTGTFTRTSSSFTSLLGDNGVFGLILFSLILIVLVLKVQRNMLKHGLFTLGFASGIYTLCIGFFMDSWFWGSDVLLLIVAFAGTLQFSEK